MTCLRIRCCLKLSSISFAYSSVSPKPGCVKPCAVYKQRICETRQTQPFHAAGGRYQRPGLAVGEKPVLSDRRKRTRVNAALGAQGAGVKALLGSAAAIIRHELHLHPRP